MLLFDLYHSHHLSVNDSWYVEHDGVYHNYFLQFDYQNEPEEYQWSKQTIGHSTSTDLINWTYEGTVIDCNSAEWLDFGVATGSIVKHNGLWYMLFTSKPSDPNKKGLAIAVSKDLMKWDVVGDGPVVSARKYYKVNYNGKEHTARIMADPYVYPEPIDGYFYIFVNSHISHHQPNERGGQLVFVTKDFINFECKTIAAIGYCDRIETPQVWKHGDKYYMYAGSVYGYNAVTPLEPSESYIEWINWSTGKSINAILVSDNIDGPYKFLNELHVPDDEEGSCLYIAKVLKDPNGDDVMLINDIPFGVRGPFKMIYSEENGICLESSKKYIEDRQKNCVNGIS